MILDDDEETQELYDADDLDLKTATKLFMYGCKFADLFSQVLRRAITKLVASMRPKTLRKVRH